MGSSTSVVTGPVEGDWEASSGLRSERLILPSFLASSSFWASSGASTSVTTCDLGARGSTVCPAGVMWPVDSTFTFCRMVAVVASAMEPGRVKITSTREPGWMSPATPVTSVICTDTAR